jgi:hypothetical protein
MSGIGGMSTTSSCPYRDALACCIEQAASGKGEERHGHGRAFVEQPWLTIAHKNGVGFLIGQADKKWHEAQTTQRGIDHAWWIREVTGSIVYTLMALIHLCHDNVRIHRCNEIEIQRSAKDWLIGAWPADDVRKRVPLSERDFVVGLTAHDKVVKALQCQVLRYAEALCARLDSAGIAAPRFSDLPDVRRSNYA